MNASASAPSSSDLGQARTNLRIIAGSFAAYNIATMSLWLQPAVVSDFVTNKGFSSGQAGLIASLEMITVAATMFLWSRYGPQTSFLKLALTGVATAMFASATCIFVDSFGSLLTLRFIAAIGFGLTMIVPSMALAGLANPNILYARMYAISLVCSAGVLAALPLVAEFSGLPPAFPTFLAYGALMLPFISLIPRHIAARAGQSADQMRAKTASVRNSRAILFIAVGLSALGLSYGSVWAFFIVLGTRAGLTLAEASSATALCLLAAIAGSLLSGFAARRISTLPLMAGCAAAVTLGILTLALTRDPLAFRVGGCLTLVSLYILIPKALGTAAIIDRSGQGAARVNASILFVGAAGPYLGGVVRDVAGFEAMSIVSIAAFAVSIIAFVLLNRANTSIGPAAAEV